jgi:hypothetical protein
VDHEGFEGIQAGLLTYGVDSTLRAFPPNNVGSGSSEHLRPPNLQGPPITVAGPWPIFAAFPFIPHTREEPGSVPANLSIEAGNAALHQCGGFANPRQV